MACITLMETVITFHFEHNIIHSKQNMQIPSINTLYMAKKVTIMLN